MKRHIKILSSSILIAATLLAAGYFGIYTEKSRRVIKRESNNRGLQCLWRVNGQQDTDHTPSWWQIMRGARPTHVSVEWPAFEKDRQATREFAAALRFFGSLESIGVGYRCPEVMTLLNGVGRQPHLTQLNCFHAPATDAISSALAGFPRLQGISLVPSEFTGRDFPPMPDLQAADFSGCPISDAGLRAIAASPKLTTIKIADHPHPSPSLHRAIRELLVSHPNVEIWGLDPSSP